MIRFESVSKAYAGAQTLIDVSFEVQKGEIVSLIGPSGCGKTTTLRMVNRLIEPTSGNIFVQNEDISKLNAVELRRNIGYVIQQVGLLPHMTIGKNIGLVPKLKGWKETDYSQRIDNLLEMVGLDPHIFRNRYPSELSGGQQQRIGVIRALAAEPPIVLMDEPFSALDPISREQLQDELSKLQKEIHKTILFVTHDMDEALKISDRIAIMNKGSIIQLDTPKNILSRPANRFVSEFIGEKRLSASNVDSKKAVAKYMIRSKTKLQCNQTVGDAMKLLRQNGEEAWIVSDLEGKYYGIVTLEALQCHSRPDDCVEKAAFARIPVLESDESWEKAAAQMLENKLNVLPIAICGDVVGYVTKESILLGLSGAVTKIS